MADSFAHGRTAPLGSVSISIDADVDVDSRHGKAANPAAAGGTALHAVLLELLDRCQRHQLPVTWALANPATNPIAGRIIGSGAGHEIALLQNSALMNGNCSRADFVRTVIQPLAQSAAAGIAISTMVVAGPWQQLHVDLLTKHGIKVIRSQQWIASPQTAGAVSVNLRRVCDGVQTICFGMWHVPVSATLHGGGWMANHAQLRMAKRSIQGVALGGGMCHVRIDAVTLARGDSAIGLRHIDRLLRDLHHLRAGSHIAVSTLSDIPQRLQSKRSVAARSILRAA